MKNSDASRTSDAEVTRPQNEMAGEDSPAWHVHLELRPEELVALHRLGFTGGALAWREGMHDWQPLHVGEAKFDDATAALGPTFARENTGSSSKSGRYKAGSRTTLRPVGKGEPPRPPAIFSRGHHSVPPLANALPIPLTRPEIVPPPPPVEPRPISEHPSSEPLPAFTDYWSKIEGSKASFTGPGQDAKPLTLPPPVSLETRSFPPRPQSGSRALWLGAAALVALSASNGALVSALLWSLRHDATRAAAASRANVTARDGDSSSRGAIACPTPSAGSAFGADRPATLSVDQLPLAATAAASTAPESEEKASATDAAASSEAHKGASAAHARRATAAPPPIRAVASKKGGAPVVLAEELAPSRTLPTPSSSQGPDRHAIAQAVARAAAAASSCSQGPEKGRVNITFAPSGAVLSVQLVQSFGEAGINSCVLRAMGRAKVSPFTGTPITVGKTLSW